MRILGIRVDEYNMEQAVSRILERCRAPYDGELAQVITINPEGVMLARDDRELAAIAEQAFLVTPDGSGILWAAERMGTPLQERVTGIDMTEALCHAAAKEGLRVYFLGAKPGLADEAARRLQERYPGLQVAGCDNGYFRDREAEAIARVREAQPDLLLAALGMPYQERWLHAHRQELGCKVAMGVGGCFDVLAGAVRRAPVFVQRLRMEWLWRLLADPKRWRRGLAIPRYMRAVGRSIRKGA